ncbi:MAG: YceH family protein, partial [Terriglobales bacterium]
MEVAWKLSPESARVLGALLEKESTTPEYYPLSLNALQAACNQKSNRDPVMDVDEDRVRLALRNLEDKHLVELVHEGRVPKFRHRLQEALNLTRGQSAVICLLLLRGAQTPGELRSRSERLYGFGGLDEVQAVLSQLQEHDPVLVLPLPRAPGTKEVRYGHCLSGTAASAPDLLSE